MASFYSIVLADARTASLFDTFDNLDTNTTTCINPLARLSTVAIIGSSVSIYAMMLFVCHSIFSYLLRLF